MTSGEPPCSVTWTGAGLGVGLLILLSLLGAGSFVATATDDGTTWRGTRYLSEPYVVQADEHLRVEAGARVLGSDRSDPEAPRPELIVHGRLTVHGTATDPVRLGIPIVIHDDAGSQDTVSGHHVLFQPESEHAACALDVKSGSVSLTDATFRTAHAGACASGPISRLDIQGSQFIANRVGISIDQGAHATVKDTSFERNRIGLDVLLHAGPRDPGPISTVRSHGNTFIQHVDPTSEARSDGYFPRSNAVGIRVQTTHPLAFDPSIKERFEGWGAWNWTVHSLGDTFRENTLAIYLGPGVALVALHDAVVEDNEVGIRNAAEPDGPGSRLNAHIYGSRFSNGARDIYSEGEHQDLFWTKSEIHPSCLLEESRPPNPVCRADRIGLFIEDLGVLASLAAVLTLLVAWFTEAGAFAIFRHLPLSPFYNLIDDGELLDLEVREDLYTIVEEEPGLHLRELSRRVGGYGRTVYHLQRMEEGGLLVSERDGFYRRFYIQAASAPEEADGASGIREKVLKIIQDNPGTYASEIARQIGTSRQLVYYHVKTLESAQEIYALEEGRTKALFPVR